MLATNHGGGDVWIGRFPFDHQTLRAFEIVFFHHHFCVRLRFRHERHLLKLRLVSSPLVFLALAAPWHVLAAIRTPSQGDVRGFLWFYFVNEHFRRFIGTRVPPGYDTVPLGIFWALLIAWLLPWSAFLPPALRDVPWRMRQWKSGLDARQQAMLVCVLWVLVVVGFFSFSTRQEYYTIPAVPGMALLVGAPP